MAYTQYTAFIAFARFDFISYLYKLSPGRRWYSRRRCRRLAAMPVNFCYADEGADNTHDALIIQSEEETYCLYLHGEIAAAYARRRCLSREYFRCF